MKPDERRVVGVPQLLWGALKYALFALVLATPVLGVWLASSLAAWANVSPQLCIVAGLLLFPIVPLLWELWTAKPGRTSRFVDRLFLRTLALSVAFIGALLAAFPTQSFVALSTRGDWFLDGKQDADGLRSAIFSTARGLEWLYHAAHENPYEKTAPKDQPKVEPKPDQKPTSSSTPPALTWPMPATLHPAVRAMTAGDEASIDSVGRYLRTHTNGTADRIKAIHDYVVDRIAYDVEALALYPNLPESAYEPEQVFARHKGVCAGYASLLRSIAAVTGDQIEYVVGDARTSSSDEPGGPGHAWSAAMIDGHWQLIDATWDAGSVGDKGFSKAYSTTYLFTPPEVFGVDHRPTDDAWQLRDKTIDSGTFFRQPLMHPSFFASGLALVAPDRSQVAVHGTFEAQIRRLRGGYLSAVARPLPSGRSTECAIAGSDVLRVRCDLAPGKYDVDLFHSSTELGSYESVGSFEVNSAP